MMLGIGSPFGSPWQIFGRADETQQAIYIGMFLVFVGVGFGPLVMASSALGIMSINPTSWGLFSGTPQPVLYFCCSAF